MLELILNFVFLALVILAIFFLYYQTMEYREQKELINKESKNLRILRRENLAALRSRFFLRKVKIKA